MTTKKKKTLTPATKRGAVRRERAAARAVDTKRALALKKSLCQERIHGLRDAYLEGVREFATEALCLDVNDVRALTEAIGRLALSTRALVRAAQAEALAR